MDRGICALLSLSGHPHFGTYNHIFPGLDSLNVSQGIQSVTVNILGLSKLIKVNQIPLIWRGWLKCINHNRIILG